MTWPNAEVIAALQQALFVEVNGGEVEPITDVYKPEGCAVVLANAVRPFLADAYSEYE